MKNITYKSILKYLFCAFLLYLSNNLLQNVPFSLSFLPAFLSLNFCMPMVALIFCAINFLSFSPLLCLALFPGAIFYLIVFAIYKRKKRIVKGELFIYVLISLIPYFLFDFGVSFYKKLAYSAIIYAFAVIFSLFLKVLFAGGFKRKTEKSENLATYISIAILSIALIQITSVAFYKFLALTILLICVLFYKNTKCLACAILLSCPLSLFTKDFSHIAIFAIYSSCALLFVNVSHLLSAIALLFVQGCICYFTGEFTVFEVIDYFYSLLPTLIFLFIPNRLIERLKDYFSCFSPPKLTRELINSERAQLSLKLNNLAQTFYEVESSLSFFNDIFLTKDALCEKICEEICVNVCSSCEHFQRCFENNKPEKEDLLKLIRVGISKGKVTLIDLSRDFSSYCYSTANIINEINNLILTYNEKQKECEKVKGDTLILSSQSRALSEVLKSLAFDLSHRIEFKKESEEKIFNCLALQGVFPKQIVCIEDKYHLVFGKEKIIYSAVAKAISIALNEKLCLTAKIDLAGGILATFEKAPSLDACFGIASKIKEGSCYSGDCHTLSKIDRGKFIVALCDGMGSGENARKNSSVAISLFENLFKIGLNKERALELTNEILSACSGESFATLDCALFDLYENKIEIIKIGATYGFLICENEVQILENSSLPLGVLEEVCPNFFSLSVKKGDILVMLSDGVTDAFFSSTDTVDYLTANKSKNPQVLANKILSYALSQYGGIAKDDMTAIVIKVY